MTSPVVALGPSPSHFPWGSASPERVGAVRQLVYQNTSQESPGLFRFLPPDITGDSPAKKGKSLILLLQDISNSA